MKKKIGLKFFIFIFGILLLVTVFSCINKYWKTKQHSTTISSNKSIKYWDDLLQKNESDFDYIIKWLYNNQEVSYIYKSEKGVCYEKKDECLTNMDTRITKFVEKNNITIGNPEEEAGNVISFTHEFFEGKSVVGNYRLMHYKDEKLVKNSFYEVRESFHKIRNGYYCDTIFYE